MIHLFSPFFVKYLTTKPATLDVQIDAAMAYQKWGEKSKDKGKIGMAVMRGGEVTDPKSNKTISEPPAKTISSR